MKFEECTRLNTCYDCNDDKCHHVGDKGADCPKYRCNRPGLLCLDCNHCAFVDNYIEYMREEYAKEKEVK